MHSEDSKFLKFLGVESIEIKKNYSKTIDKDKIIVLADLHEPFADVAVYDSILKDHHDAAKVIIAGDVADFFSKSRFRRTKHYPFKAECRSVFDRFKWFAEHFRQTEIMIGNHDTRAEKVMADLLRGQEDMLELTEQNLVKRIASFFPSIKIVGTKVRSSNIELSHIYQHGDIIFCHAEISRMQSSATLERISLQLHRWKDTYGLQPFRVIAQAHNHDAMKSVKGGEVWMMLPSGINPKSIGAEYIYGSRMVGNPPATGYTVVYQRNGETDINKTNFILLYE